MAKESLLESSISHIVILITLSILILEDSKSSFLIFTPTWLNTSETRESTSVASYVDLLFTRDENNNVITKLYNKRDVIGFHIVNFLIMSSNIPSAWAYGVCASQLIRYARYCLKCIWNEILALRFFNVL